jgi:tetratricopeptide (TPR) repeat protein
MNQQVKKLSFTLVALLLSGVFFRMLTGCNPSPQTAIEADPDLQSDQEAISFLGDTLLRPPMDQPSFHRADSLLEEAFTFYKEDSTDLQAIIWYGRRLAYLHRYRDAIDVFTNGIHAHPQSPELYRHRGHRYITTRRPDLAISDLEKAVVLAKGRDMEIEPDGIPNKLDIPLSNLHFNIYYHLGLAYYLRQDFPKAIEAFKSCMRYSDNPDLKVATTFWLYLSHLRSGDADVAEILLADIDPNMEIIENDAYLQQLLIFKTGDQSIPETAIGSDTRPFATTQYGISCWHEAHGRKDVASTIRKEILLSDMWPVFGFIAAEADSSRLIVQ